MSDTRAADFEGLTFAARVEFPAERVWHLLSAGFQGIGYWAQVVDQSYLMKFISEEPIHPNGFVLLRDIMSEKEYVLDQVRVARGLQLFAEKYPRVFAAFMRDNEDADTGDAFIQLCLLGEVIYG